VCGRDAPRDAMPDFIASIATIPTDAVTIRVALVAAAVSFVAAMIVCAVFAAWAIRRLRCQASAAPDENLQAASRAEVVAAEAESLALRRAAELRALIAEADERLALLGRAIEIAAPLPVPPERAVPNAQDVEHTERDESGAGTSRPATDPFANEVIRLASQGYAAVEIARRLDTSPGMVELILALEKASGGSTPAVSS
jgi:hypothetical protein